MNDHDHFLNIQIFHIRSVPYSNIESIRIWQIPFKMGHIEGKSIENWSECQQEYEFMPFPIPIN